MHKRYCLPYCKWKTAMRSYMFPGGKPIFILMAWPFSYHSTSSKTDKTQGTENLSLFLILIGCDNQPLVGLQTVFVPVPYKILTKWLILPKFQGFKLWILKIAKLSGVLFFVTIWLKRNHLRNGGVDHIWEKLKTFST